MPMSPPLVFVESLTMVGDEEHYCILGQSPAVKFIKQPAYVVVDISDGTVILRNNIEVVAIR